MKTLFLVRHAKSSKDDPALRDEDRPLNERGHREAQEMGKRMARHDARPDLILASPAVRALATARLIAAELDYAIDDIEVDRTLYASDVGTLLAVVHKLDDHALRCVMVVGHNPEMSELAHRLSSQIAEMPTCAVAEFGFDAKSWSEVGKVAPTRVVFDAPKKS